jgi:hypothetical protein
MINFVTSSVSVILIALAIVILALYPHDPSIRQFAIALFLWFLALGPLRWIERRIADLLESLIDKDNEEWDWLIHSLSILFVFAEIGLISSGIAFFVYGIRLSPP